jgi:hypothetical protein
MIDAAYLKRLAFQATKLAWRVVVFVTILVVPLLWKAVMSAASSTDSDDFGGFGDANDAIPTRGFSAMHSGGYGSVGDESGPF